MKFEITEYTDNCFSVKTATDHNISIEFDFINNECDSFRIDEYEIEDDDTLNGVFVFIDKQFYSLSMLLSKARRFYESAKSELDEERKAELNMVNELSSPQQTGRI